MDRNRKTAYEVLLQIEKHGAYSNLELNRRIQEDRPDAPALVRELVYGVLEHKLYLGSSAFPADPEGTLRREEAGEDPAADGAVSDHLHGFCAGVRGVSETVQLAKKVAAGESRLCQRCPAGLRQAEGASDPAGSKAGSHRVPVRPLFLRSVDRRALGAAVRPGKDRVTAGRRKPEAGAFRPRQFAADQPSGPGRAPRGQRLFCPGM